MQDYGSAEYWKEQCRRLTSSLERSLMDKHALTERIHDNSEEAKTARAVADGLEWEVEDLKAENARLRELVTRDERHRRYECRGCPRWGECVVLVCGRCLDIADIEEMARELGIEVSP